MTPPDGTTATGPSEHELFKGTGDLKRRYWIGRIGKAATAIALLLAAAFLAVLLWDVLQRGAGAVDWAFLTNDVSARFPEQAGVFNAIVGSAFLIGVTMAIALPVGVGAAVYLEEFAEDAPMTRGLQRLIENLAGVPSIVFGLLGLWIFVRQFGLGTSILSGGLTLALLVLPIIVVSAQEALSTVPEEFRDAARALGATEWQVVKDHVLPNALPGILTGSILALSRAIGETAPILFMASVFMKGSPTALLDGFLALPVQIFTWVTLPDPAWHELAGAAIIVLLGLLLIMNATAVIIRQWSLSRRNW